MIHMYKTKTQKKNAMKAIQSKAMKLFASGAISMKDAEAISRIVNMRMKQLWVECLLEFMYTIYKLQTQ